MSVREGRGGGGLGGENIQANQSQSPYSRLSFLSGFFGFPILLLRVGEWVGFMFTGVRHLAPKARTGQLICSLQLFFTHTPREKEEFRRQEVWDIAPPAAGQYCVIPTTCCTR